MPRIKTGRFAFGGSGARFHIPLDAINDAYKPHLCNTARTQIFFGGSSSGKSVFCVGQRPVFDVLNNRRNYLICRQIFKDNRRSTFVEVKNAIEAWGLNGRFRINETTMTMTADTGYQILFAGLDDVEKIKSIRTAKGALTDIVVEEATQTEHDDVRQLFKRQRGGDPNIPKRLTLLFNPILQSSWIYQTYFSPLAWADKQTEHNDGRLSILKTWYIHNKHLTPDDIYDLECETNPYFRDVYTYGNWGVLGDVIFTNWETADLSGMTAQFTNHRHGLDFGFNNPTALVRVVFYDGECYLSEELFESRLTNAELITRMEGISSEIYADCAEPNRIEEISRAGFNIHPANKDVSKGIDTVKSMKLHVLSSSVNLLAEIRGYKWKEDRNGNVMDEPVKWNDHLMDALRYAIHTHTIAFQPSLRYL
jgi:phage terminase large subunit